MNEFENRKNINQNDGGTQKKSYRFDVIALVLCLVIAIGIWLYVMNSNQETAEKTIIITIDAIAQVEKETNMSIITGSELMDYSKIMVELTVTGTKSAIEKYEDSQYVVELDTSTLEDGKAGKYNQNRVSGGRIIAASRRQEEPHSGGRSIAVGEVSAKART